MNDHIAKPIDPATLFSSLLHFIDDTETAQSAAPTPAAPNGHLVIAGMDTTAGLQRVLGNERLYLDILRRFVDGEEAQAVKSIRTLLAQDNRESAERTAHSLKGVAGTIGASELQRRAAELEAALRDGSDVDTLLCVVDEELATMVERIRGALPQSTADHTHGDTDVDWDAARDTVSQLADLLAASDSTAIDLFEQSQELLQAALGSHYSEVQSPLQGWNLAGALSALRVATAAVPRLNDGHGTATPA